MPTLGEAACPAWCISWTGLRAGEDPPDVVAKLSRAINDALKSPDGPWRVRGSDPLGGTAQDFSALLSEEGPKWVEVVKSSGIKID